MGKIILVASIILILSRRVKPLLQDFTAIGLPQLPTRNGILRFRTVDLIITADQNRTSESYMPRPRLAAVA